MKNFWVNLAVLMGAIVVVHIVHLGVIRPQAELAIEIARQAGQSAPRDFAVILKDLEQEICLILMLWCIWLISHRLWGFYTWQHYLDFDIFEEVPPGKTTPERYMSELDRIGDEEQGFDTTPLTETLKAGLRRYRVTDSVHLASDAIRDSLEAIAFRTDADNALIRYVTWAVPSIGFIGTVRGIGQALANAEDALAGDITGMTESLGVAFNSTLVALVISIFLVFFSYILQKRQDEQLVRVQEYCDRYLLRRLGATEEDGQSASSAPPPSASTPPAQK